MLKQMKETFENNLEQSKSDEATAAKSFQELKVAKSAELKAAIAKAEAKTTELGNTQEANARAKEDLDNTEDALELDTEFLAMLKKKCATLDADWAARSKMRSEEITAVSETIAILTDDEAHDTLTRGTTLIQVRSQASRETQLRAQAVKFLKDAGDKLKSRRIAYLATRMKFDPFGQLRGNIDTMVGALGKEKDDEIHHKDDCVSDLNENDKQTTERNEHKSDVEQEINDLDADVEHLNAEEKCLMQEISDAQIEMKKASENREKENKEFQQTVADQRATQA